MAEAIALFAAVLSAAAAAVGAVVSVAQWRHSTVRSGQTDTPGTPADSPAPAATTAAQAPPTRTQPSQRDSPAVRRPTRSAVVAVALATICCVFTAVGLVAYLVRQADGGAPPNPLEVFAILAIPVSIAGLITAFLSLGAGFRRNARLAFLALVGCVISLASIWVYGR